MMKYDYDLICIGGGSGGIATARRAAEYGAKVAVIEADRLGGTCVNVGCVPKKLFWYAAHHAEAQENAHLFGFAQNPSPKIDWLFFKQARDAYLARLNGIYASNLEKSGVDLFRGAAQFEEAHCVRVGDKVLSAAHIVIATGGRPSIPNIQGAEYGITSDGFFALEQQPKRVLIVGGGYIACEIANVMQALGSECALIVRANRLLKTLDDEISASLADNLQEQGINLHFETEVAEVKKEDHQLVVLLNTGQCLEADCLIWATGRTPNTDTLALERVGIKEKNGYIHIDAKQNTNIAQHYAIGDITGQMALTPVAIRAGRELAARLFNQQSDAQLDESNIPTVIFTHPPIATIGLSEAAARAQYGENLRIYRSTFTPMSRTFSLHKPKTRFKLICQGEEERIVGLHMIGDNVDEILQGFAVAIKMGACKSDFDACIAIHPTSAEELVTLR